MRWCWYCDEYDILIKNIADKENILADFLSWLPCIGLDEATERESLPNNPLDDSNWIVMSYDALQNLTAELDSELADCFVCFMSLPTTIPEESPLDYEWSYEQQ